MLGLLPTSLTIHDKEYEINTDYRNILTIISAFNDEELRDEEKMFICMARLFADFYSIPKADYQEAYEKAVEFVECQMKSDRPSPKIVDWDKDEQLMFAAVNKVAGMEIRAESYMHWWTFIGYFQNIDRDSLWGYILTIRQKKAKGKKLDKAENEFYLANKSMIDVGRVTDRKLDAEMYADELFKALLEEQREIEVKEG
jgi:hypothetical protein